MVATTTKLALPKPQGTDNVRDYSIGVIAGGGLHNALDTLDNAILETLVDAKGDLIAGTAADDVGRLAAGANGAILITDSAQTTGLAWKAIGTARQRLRVNSGASAPEWYDEPAMRAYHNANQSIANTSLTALALNSERWDTDTIHDNVTNNTRGTCKTAGKYAGCANVRFDINGTGIRQVIVRLNGATDIASAVVLPPAASFCDIAVPFEYDLAVNDYLEVVVYQSSGGALNVVAQGNISPEFAMHRVG